MAELEQRAMDCELMEMQQKEFINYLEDEIKTLEKDILETVDDVDIYIYETSEITYNRRNFTKIQKYDRSIR
ncbi:unknown [Mycoplasma sp. CAG:877]|nr:unknown [Mycoplasma sp. CAG:877]